MHEISVIPELSDMTLRLELFFYLFIHNIASDVHELFQEALQLLVKASPQGCRRGRSEKREAISKKGKQVDESGGSRDKNEHLDKKNKQDEADRGTSKTGDRSSDKGIDDEKQNDKEIKEEQKKTEKSKDDNKRKDSIKKRINSKDQKAKSQSNVVKIPEEEMIPSQKTVVNRTVSFLW